MLSAVQSSYANLQALEEELEILKRRKQVVDQLFKLTEGKQKAGEGSRADVSMVQTHQVELDVDMEDLHWQAADERLALTRLIGQPSGAAEWKIAPWQPPPDLSNVEQAWLAAAMQNRPELRAKEWELAALGAQRRGEIWAPLQGSDIGVHAERDATWNLGPAVTVPLPNITSLNPTSGPVGTSVIITGTNFGASQGASTVRFNGTAATPTAWSATSITAPVPGGATTGNVIVTVGGVASNGVSFTVIVPTPSITSLNPTSGLIGTSVTITGTNFGASQGPSTVTFNGIATSPTSWSATSIAAPVPNGATTGNVIVTVSGVASNVVLFTVTSPGPTLSSLGLTQGPVGATVTITGANFGATQGTSTVTFNGTTGTPSAWSDTSIDVPVPVALPALPDRRLLREFQARGSDPGSLLVRLRRR